MDAEMLLMIVDWLDATLPFCEVAYNHYSTACDISASIYEMCVSPTEYGLFVKMFPFYFRIQV